MKFPLYFLLFAFSCLAEQVLAQTAKGQDKGYKIEVEIEGFKDTVMYLANYFLDKQYIVDTVPAKNGKGVFSGDEPLKQGMYLLVLPPQNDYAQVLIDGDQHFKLKTKVSTLTAGMKVSGSDENELFFGYLQLLDKLRPEADSLRKIVADSSLTAKQHEIAQAKVDAIDKKVKAEQTRIKSGHPKTITASLLRSFDEAEIPAFTGTDSEVQQQKYLYYKDHYFDNIDLSDPRALRSTFLDQRVTYYMDKLVIPIPDSINNELDMLLERMRPAPETFRAYVSKFLNQYAASKIVGQDAVYAHLGEKYYMGGQTPWVDSTTLAKISENVLKLKPLLIGQPAPPLPTFFADGKPFKLDSVDADYTVVFFFDPECGVCKKQTPVITEFAKKYADKGVKVVSVCTKLGADGANCWLYVKDHSDMKEVIINTYDPAHRSRFKINWDISSTPQIFVLDKDKRILSKRIGAEQLEEVISRLMELRGEHDQAKAGR